MKKILKTLTRSRLIIAVSLLTVSVTSHSAAPQGRYTLTTNVVIDNATGLIWERNVNPNSYPQANAAIYCSSLSLGGWSSGWRLPTKKELQSIVDVRVFSPAIDAVAFPSAPSGAFWSSSPSAFNTSSAWVVGFNYGNANSYSTGNSYRVRCVR
jgi:hypothetical protein